MGCFMKFYCSRFCLFDLEMRIWDYRVFIKLKKSLLLKSSIVKKPISNELFSKKKKKISVHKFLPYFYPCFPTRWSENIFGNIFHVDRRHDRSEICPCEEWPECDEKNSFLSFAIWCNILVFVYFQFLVKLKFEPSIIWIFCILQEEDIKLVH